MSKTKIFHIGNVGINEGSPQRYLHVTGNASYGAAHFGVFGTNAGNAYIGNTPVVTISTDGNANAGTNDEKALFQVGRGGGGAGAAAVTTEHFRVNLGGTVQIGGAVGNNSHIDIQNTKLTIKQSANNREDGIYIERAGESRGFHIYVGGALSQNDALGIASQQLGGKTDVVSIDRGGDIEISSSNFTQAVTSGAAIFQVKSIATSGDALIQASGEDSSGNTRMIQMRTDSGASQYRIISSDTSYSLALCTGNSPRLKIAGNSAATSIGGSNTFNAMLTTQGDVSGGLLMLKATEDTNRFFVTGNNTSGCEVNLYDDTGAQKGILAASTNNFAIKAAQDVTMQFMTNDGYGTVERAALDKHGIFKAHGFRRNKGNVGFAYNNLRNGYMGDDWSLGPGAWYYIGHKSSGSSSNYSAHELTIYRSGHWGQYPEIIVYAYMYYYQSGYRIWHIDDGGTITQKDDFTSGGAPSISSGGQQLVGSGTNGGQNVHKYEITFSNSGTYQQVKWFVGFIGGGGAGHIGNSKTVSQADSHFAVNGGGLHFPNVAHEGMQGSPYYQY